MSDNYELHRPDVEGTSKDDWQSHTPADYEADDLANLAGHFLLSASGFPPQSADDLALPVVDEDGDLNLNALEAARAGAEGVDVDADLAPETHAEARRLVETLVGENFESGDPEAGPEGAPEQRGEARDAAQTARREQDEQEKRLREDEAQEASRENIPPDQDASG